MKVAQRRWRWAALICLLQAVPVWAASLEGEALYRKRLLSPAGVTVVPVLQLRMVQMNAGRCAGVATQVGMNDCAYEEFLETSAGMSRQLGLIETALTLAQRSQWRRVQKAWLTYRTEACQFEASAVGNGSARPMVQWQCADRMTRQRTAELFHLTACPEGDIACPVPRLQRAP